MKQLKRLLMLQIVTVGMTVMVVGCGNVTPYNATIMEGSRELATEVADLSTGNRYSYEEEQGELGIGDADTEFVNSTESVGRVDIDDSFNSYYHVEGGTAVANTGSQEVEDVAKSEDLSKSSKDSDDATESMTESKQTGEQKGEEETEKKAVIKFVDENDSQSSQSRATVTMIQATVDSVNKTIPLVNSSQNEIRYQFEENGEIIYDTGLIKPGETVYWDAYSLLTDGSHELTYHFEQIGNGVTIVEYQAVANIQRSE